MATVTPKLYVLQYEYVENVLEKRAPFREAHLAVFGKQVQDGNIVIGGTINYPPTGAMTIFRNLTSDGVDEIVKQDPYYINGLVTNYTIKPYIAVVGDDVLKNDLIKV